MSEMKTRDIFTILAAGVLIGLVIAIAVYKSNSLKPEIRYDINGDDKVTPYDAVKIIDYYLEHSD